MNSKQYTSCTSRKKFDSELEFLMSTLDEVSIELTQAEPMDELDDFADAFVSYAEYITGEELTDAHYELLNNQTDFVYSLAWEQVH